MANSVFKVLKACSSQNTKSCKYVTDVLNKNNDEAVRLAKLKEKLI